MLTHSTSLEIPSNSYCSGKVKKMGKNRRKNREKMPGNSGNLGNKSVEPG